MRRPPLLFLLLGITAAVLLGGCSRGDTRQADSRLLIRNLTDPTPYDRVVPDKGEYIQHLPR